MPIDTALQLHKPLELRVLIRALVSAGRLSAEQAQQITQYKSAQSKPEHPLAILAGHTLEDCKRPGRTLDIETLTQWLAKEVEQPYVRIDPLKMDVAALTPLMSHAFSQHHQILAVAASTETVTIASAQPFISEWEDTLAPALKRSIKRVLVNPVQLQHYITEFYRLARSVSRAKGMESQTALVSGFEQLLKLSDSNKAFDADDAHIVTITDWIFKYAFAQQASDIHIEPRRAHGNVRFRIDGVLHQVYQLPGQITVAVASRLKTLGRMNVAEKRKPQDGRIKTQTPEGASVELRLATLPTAFGEKIVMRIFDPDVLLKTPEKLGFSSEDLRRWEQMTHQPNGIILVTGPTGSGKTTTLYTTLKLLATDEVNVCTIEDPIEMIEESFNQMQVQHQIDLGFASAVRALMRQDPDIIMIGEIRDLETAEMAIQAALTGHLVLSTLHTNDAPSAVVRLLELGVPYYLIKSTVLGVMAQRLVRVLCAHCKTPAQIDPADWQLLTKPWNLAHPAQPHRAVGCPECRDTGYAGRLGVYEIMLLNEQLKTLITKDTDLVTLRQQAYKEGMYSLRLSGALKISAGLTTIEEVLRVTPQSTQD